MFGQLPCHFYNERDIYNERELNVMHSNVRGHVGYIVNRLIQFALYYICLKSPSRIVECNFVKFCSLDFWKMGM